MKRLALLVLVVSGMSRSLGAQDMDPYFAPRAAMVLDPSRTGFAPGVQLHLFHVDQWLQLPGTWRTELLAAEWCTRNGKKQTNSWIGLGLLAVQDINGSTNGRASSLACAPAVHLRTSERSFLSSGFELRMVSHAYGDNGAWGSQYDGMHFDAGISSGEAQPTGTAQWMEARAGFSWTLKQDAESPRRRERDAIVLGVAADHLGRIVLHEAGLPIRTAPVRFTAYALLEQGHEIWDNGFFSADAIVQVQDPFGTGRVNVHAGKHLLNTVRKPGGPHPVGFRAGCGYRFKDAFLVDAGIDLSRFSFNLAYGWAVVDRDLLATGRRTVEMCLQLRLGA